MTMHVDVSALQRDPLTKLPNRTLFDAQLDFAIASAKDGNGRVGLLLVDVNNLKLINDRYGHACRGLRHQFSRQMPRHESLSGMAWSPASAAMNSLWS